MTDVTCEKSKNKCTIHNDCCFGVSHLLIIKIIIIFFSLIHHCSGIWQGQTDVTSFPAEITRNGFSTLDKSVSLLHIELCISAAAPLTILTGMHGDVRSGLTVIMTRLQADTVHVSQRHDAKALLWL